MREVPVTEPPSELADTVVVVLLVPAVTKRWCDPSL